MSIGSRIKERRELLNLSQEELALKLGYKSRSTINKIESGINDISQSKVVEFAKVLQTTPAYLMGCEDEEQKNSDDSGLNSAFFRLKKGLEPYDLDEEDAEFLLTVFKAHKEKNK